MFAHATFVVGVDRVRAELIGGLEMLETSAEDVIAATIGGSFGGSGEVTVSGHGFRIMANKAAAARCIGTNGRVFRAVG